MKRKYTAKEKNVKRLETFLNKYYGRNTDKPTNSKGK
jgi:hypothetical protein